MKKWIFPGVIIVVLLLFFEFYTKPNHPPFFQDNIDELIHDEKLMTSIGGYKNFAYTFNKKELKTDTLNFTITILGHEKKAVCKGQAIKNLEQDWIVLKKDVMVKD